MFTLWPRVGAAWLRPARGRQEAEGTEARRPSARLRVVQEPLLGPPETLGGEEVRADTRYRPSTSVFMSYAFDVPSVTHHKRSSSVSGQRKSSARKMEISMRFFQSVRFDLEKGLHRWNARRILRTSYTVQTGRTTLSQSMIGKSVNWLGVAYFVVMIGTLRESRSGRVVREKSGTSGNRALDFVQDQNGILRKAGLVGVLRDAGDAPADRLALLRVEERHQLVERALLLRAHHRQELALRFALVAGQQAAEHRPGGVRRGVDDRRHRRAVRVAGGLMGIAACATALPLNERIFEFEERVDAGEDGGAAARHDKRDGFFSHDWDNHRVPHAEACGNRDQSCESQFNQKAGSNAAL